MFKKILKVLAVVIVIGLILYGIINKNESSSTVKIGVIVGASGPYGIIGENYTKGIELAKENWLKDHPNQKVEIIIEDDAFDPKKGIAAYQKLTSIDKVDALINMTSPTIDAIYSSVTESGLPVIQGGEQGTEPTDDNIFQILPGNIETEIALGKYIKDKGYKNVVAFHANNATYVRFLNAVEKGYGSSFTKYPINIDDRDYRSFVTKSVAQNPDAFLFLTTPEQGANLVKIIKEQSSANIPFVFDASLQTGFGDYKRILGDMSILNGSAVVTITQKTEQSFVNDYKVKYTTDPGMAADWAYDSFELLMKTQDSDSKDWVENIKDVSFDGAGGKVVFDEVGVRIPEFKIGLVENDELPK